MLPTVLLIEDDDNHAALIERLIARSGYQVHFRRCATGAQAIALLRAELLEPDLVLLDYKLAATRAPRVLSALRALPRSRHLPVVVLSTSNAQHDRQAAYEAGANSYIVKPLDPVHFAELVGQLCAYWLKWNQA